jgi:hypothetical protein
LAANAFSSRVAFLAVALEQDNGVLMRRDLQCRRNHGEVAAIELVEFVELLWCALLRVGGRLAGTLPPVTRLSSVDVAVWSQSASKAPSYFEAGVSRALIDRVSRAGWLLRYA